MKDRLASLYFIRTIKAMRGNARAMMPFEPMLSIPLSLISFYMGLYMKGQGLTAQQMGYLISIQFASSLFFSFFAGFVTDALGRKKALLISDLIAWPGVVLVWFFADSFALFAVAAVISGVNIIVNVSWTCYLVEDITSQERAAAYNLVFGLGLCSGVFIPLSGALVQWLGLVNAQRAVLLVSLFIMTARIFLRNHYSRETFVGMKILEERRNARAGVRRFRPDFNISAIKAIAASPRLLVAILMVTLFQIYMSTAAMTSSCLYYVPFLTEQLGIGQSAVSTLGTVSAVFMLISFLFITPAAIHQPIQGVITRGILIQMLAVAGLITIARSSFIVALVCIAVYAVGYQGIQPMVSTMMADAANGKEMAGIFSVVSMVSSLAAALAGSVAGFIYQRSPVLLFGLSEVLLLLMIAIVGIYGRIKGKPAAFVSSALGA